MGPITTSAPAPNLFATAGFQHIQLSICGHWEKRYDGPMSESAVQWPVAEEPAEKINDYLELLAVIGQDFAMSLDVEATLRKALSHIMAFLDAEGASVFLLENDNTELVCRVCVGPVDITGVRLSYGQGIVGQSIVEDRCLIVRDARQDPRFASTVDEQTGFTTKSILSAPMSVKESQFGAMELINKRGGDGLFDEQDRQILQALAASAAMAINNARMTQALINQERLQRELELAAELQRSLLPDSRTDEFPVVGVNLPARTVSGDFFDYFDLADGRIFFNLGDVSGKGINASLLMAKTSSLFRCLGKTIHEPGRLLGLINREICETSTRGMFVTMVAGILDPRDGRVRLANAGHEPPLYMSSAGGFTQFQAEAPPLGIAADLYRDDMVPEIELELNGGTLYVYSDGVTEGRVDRDEMLGVDGLKALLSDLADHAPADRLSQIAKRFQGGGRALHDDLTILAVEQPGA